MYPCYLCSKEVIIFNFKLMIVILYCQVMHGSNAPLLGRIITEEVQQFIIITIIIIIIVIIIRWFGLRLLLLWSPQEFKTLGWCTIFNFPNPLVLKGSQGPCQDVATNIAWV